MSRTASGFERQPAELYETPEWVVDALVDHVPIDGLTIWEPACGPGKMVRAMQRHGAIVSASDLNTYPGVSGARFGLDFLSTTKLSGIDGIITNPPYGPRGTTATAFIRHGISQIVRGGFMALLLPIDFDCAMRRADCFEDCPQFAAKIALRKRIVWFGQPKVPGVKNNGPTENHAWFLWQATGAIEQGAPILLYGPKNGGSQ